MVWDEEGAVILNKHATLGMTRWELLPFSSPAKTCPEKGALAPSLIEENSKEEKQMKGQTVRAEKVM